MGVLGLPCRIAFISFILACILNPYHKSLVAASPNQLTKWYEKSLESRAEEILKDTPLIGMIYLIIEVLIHLLRTN